MVRVRRRGGEHLGVPRMTADVDVTLEVGDDELPSLRAT
jgi:hypothetical protein